ncbi:unnamed protein product [Rangifer tarandus platyrhynchus]|uniref:Uncharacterized protein n=2 Tax=Rangifer tarandus platyrhynchus TaxID=3082113 RepID=A0ABN8Z2B0_RANTA|nr:unnamed protein product [Rangifer tarandus platyrhynchus]CAI9705449.1 unnamed protein product [Rangifer tarandus platyrhynchus]
MRGAPQHPLHTIPPSPGCDPFVSLSPAPRPSACPPCTGFGAHDPAGVPLTAAVAARPGPRGSREEKIMNEMDAVLPLPRPPCPGNLGAGAVSAGTPSGVAGCRRPRSGSSRDEGSVIPPDSGPGRRRSSPPPRPPAPRALRNSRGAAQARPGAGRSRGRGCRATRRLRPRLCSRSPFGEAARRGSAHGARDRAQGRRTHGQTDAPAHADAQSSARSPSHTHIHTLALTHTGTHAHSRAHILPPACPPARRRPEPSGREARQLRSPPDPRAEKPAPAPATPPWGSRRPRTGGGVLHAREGTRCWGEEREQQPLPTKLVRGSREGRDRDGGPGSEPLLPWRVRGSCLHYLSRVRSSGGRLEIAASPLALLTVAPSLRFASPDRVA